MTALGSGRSRRRNPESVPWLSSPKRKGLKGGQAEGWQTGSKPALQGQGGGPKGLRGTGMRPSRQSQAWGKPAGRHLCASGLALPVRRDAAGAHMQGRVGGSGLQVASLWGEELPVKAPGVPGSLGTSVLGPHARATPLAMAHMTPSHHSQWCSVASSAGSDSLCQHGAEAQTGEGFV